MLTPCQLGKVVIGDVKWVMLVCMFIMGGGLCEQVGWAGVFRDSRVWGFLIEYQKVCWGCLFVTSEKEWQFCWWVGWSNDPNT